VYVLGALPPSQRVEFERHMATCVECQTEVNDLAVLPGLLGRLDEPTVVATAELPPPNVLPAVLHRVHRRRRGRRLVALGAVLAVACLALIAGIAMPQLGGTPTKSVPVVMHAMSPVSPSPITAQVGFTQVTGGTQIEVKCQYAWPPGETYAKQRVAVFVYPRSGAPAQQVGFWSAAPGDKVDINAVAGWPPTQVARVELRSSEGTPLLVYDPTA
jgi:hypothetical protein